MDFRKLAGPLIDAGLTVMGGAIGGPGGAIATRVGRQVLREIGAQTPEEAATRISAGEAETLERLRDLEHRHEDEWRLLAAEQAHMAEMLQRDSRGHWLERAWRPAMMWLLELLWLWGLLLAPLINAFSAPAYVALPPFETLLGLTGLYMALYMGGHTVKSVMGGRAR